MKIEVTQKHIDEGVRHSRCNCPIAKAVKEAVPAHVEVSGESIWIEGDFQLLDYPCMQFVSDFDAGRKVSPFALEIDYEPASNGRVG